MTSYWTIEWENSNDPFRQWVSESDAHVKRLFVTPMPRRPVSSDQRSISETSTGSRTDTSDATEAPVSAYEEAELSANLYPELDKFILITEFPRTLSYRQLLYFMLPNVPNILMQLVDRIDKAIPPLIGLCFGISDTSIKECDRMLTTITAARKDVNLCEQIIANCRPSQAAQLLQLLFLRLEDPPFVATDTLCDTVFQKGYFINPRMQVRKEVTSQITRITKECLSTLNVYQQATVSYFIQRCQRWCQSEVAYTIGRNPAANATTIYNEALRFLSRMFAECVIGLPRSYVASRIMINRHDSLMEIKRNIFFVLTAVISNNLWHTNSIETLYIPRDLLPPITITSPIQGNEYNTKPFIPQKIRSFNWL
ncbi:hypothetical protein FBUS_03600 [Fasciolopsis buskii]|uniref:Uncharacterized protein n=1 Tax=Fasciolopsis buskii TaxID=27845 RepID=A0A8E0S9B2_9TREM|nr:hypothetical protein FBUS_03600 [Fasciolopsis buski]